MTAGYTGVVSLFPWSTAGYTGVVSLFPWSTAGYTGVVSLFPWLTAGYTGIVSLFPWSTAGYTGVVPLSPWSSPSCDSNTGTCLATVRHRVSASADWPGVCIPLLSEIASVDLQRVSQCGRTSNCLSRTFTESHTARRWNVKQRRFI